MSTSYVGVSIKCHVAYDVSLDVKQIGKLPLSANLSLALAVKIQFLAQNQVVFYMSMEQLSKARLMFTTRCGYRISKLIRG